MPDNGWICLWRKFMKWEWYRQPYMVQLFVHLLLSANHEPAKWQGITIERGQLVTGRKKLSKDTGISEQSIRTCLALLKSTSELTIKATNRYSIITVVNYSAYQDKNPNTNQQINQPPNQQLTNSQPTTNHKQQCKQLNNDNNKTKGYFQKPSSEQLKEYGDEIEFYGFDPQAFLDHYDANGWMAGKVKMKDWRAAVRTWKRTASSNDKGARTTRTWGRFCYRCGNSPTDRHIGIIWREELPWDKISCYDAWAKEGRLDYEKEAH